MAKPSPQRKEPDALSVLKAACETLVHAEAVSAALLLLFPSLAVEGFFFLPVFRSLDQVGDNLGQA